MIFNQPPYAKIEKLSLDIMNSQSSIYLETKNYPIEYALINTFKDKEKYECIINGMNIHVKNSYRIYDFDFFYTLYQDLFHILVW